MYGINANIGGILMVNVTIYSSTMDPMGSFFLPFCWRRPVFDGYLPAIHHPAAPPNGSFFRTAKGWLRWAPSAVFTWVASRNWRLRVCKYVTYEYESMYVCIYIYIYMFTIYYTARVLPSHVIEITYCDGDSHHYILSNSISANVCLGERVEHRGNKNML